MGKNGSEDLGGRVSFVDVRNPTGVFRYLVWEGEYRGGSNHHHLVAV